MREIVIGVHDSQGSSHALEWGLNEAQSSGRPVRVLFAYHGPSPVRNSDRVEVQEARRGARRLATELLEKALAVRGPSSEVTAVADAREGDPAHVLSDASADAGLIVVNGRKRSRVLGSPLGSVTAFLLHHAACPVMVVPGELDLLGLGPGRIIVGVDASHSARSALRWALDAGRRHGCPVTVMYVCPTDVPPVTRPMAFDPKLPDFEEVMRRWVENEISECRAEGDVTVAVSQVRHGSAAAGLLFEAGPEDLLVVGSRGHGGFVGLVLGSVASQCTKHARGAVVVVRQGEERLDA